MSKKKIILSGMAGLTIIGGIGAGMLCIERVPAGMVAGLYSPSNGVENRVLENGWHFVNPMTKVSLFNISTEVCYMSADKREGSKEDESINISTKDGVINADLTYNYNFDAESVPSVQKKFRGKDGETIVNTILRGQMRSWISEVTKNYTTMEVHLTKKEEVNTKLTEEFNKKAKQYGLHFDTVSIAETRPSKEVQVAIEKRQKIAQELEQQKLNLQKTEIAKKEAQLEAERKLIVAEGERKANEEKAKGLDDKVLKEMAVKGWIQNGSKVPQVVGGNAITNLK